MRLIIYTCNKETPPPLLSTPFPPKSASSQPVQHQLPATCLTYIIARGSSNSVSHWPVVFFSVRLESNQNGGATYDGRAGLWKGLPVSMAGLIGAGVLGGSTSWTVGERLNRLMTTIVITSATIAMIPAEKATSAASCVDDSVTFVLWALSVAASSLLCPCPSAPIAPT